MLFLNPLTQWLSLGGVAIATLYPFMKRWTYLPQVVLGAAFSWGIVMAFAATDGKLTGAWLMFVASVIVDCRLRHLLRDGRPRRRSEGRHQIRRDSIRRADVTIVAILQAATIVVSSCWAHLDYGAAFFVGCASLPVCSSINNAWSATSPSHCFAAFRNNTWVGLRCSSGPSSN